MVSVSAHNPTREGSPCTSHWGQKMLPYCGCRGLLPGSEGPGMLEESGQPVGALLPYKAVTGLEGACSVCWLWPAGGPVGLLRASVNRPSAWVHTPGLPGPQPLMWEALTGQVAWAPLSCTAPALEYFVGGVGDSDVCASWLSTCSLGLLFESPHLPAHPLPLSSPRL